MRRKCHVVAPHRGLRAARVPRRVLRADEGGGVEAGRGEQVGGEAEDVEEGEGGGRAGGGAAAEVEERLRVEGERPGEGAVAFGS